MQYDEIVHFFKEPPDLSIYQNLGYFEHCLKGAKEYKVEDELLDKLKEDFTRICLISKQHKNIDKHSEDPFKYYITRGDKLFGITFPTGKRNTQELQLVNNQLTKL